MEPIYNKGKTIEILFVAALLIAAFLVVIRDLLRSGFAIGSILQGFGIVSIALVMAAWVLLESKRAREIKLSENGVSFLEWRFLPYPHLVSAQLQWSDVTKVGTRGSVILLKGSAKLASINTYIFNDPKAVAAFVNEHLQGKSPP